MDPYLSRNEFVIYSGSENKLFIEGVTKSSLAIKGYKMERDSFMINAYYESEQLGSVVFSIIKGEMVFNPISYNETTAKKASEIALALLRSMIVTATHYKCLKVSTTIGSNDRLFYQFYQLGFFPDDGIVARFRDFPLSGRSTSTPECEAEALIKLAEKGIIGNSPTTNFETAAFYKGALAHREATFTPPKQGRLDPFEFSKEQASHYNPIESAIIQTAQRIIVNPPSVCTHTLLGATQLAQSISRETATTRPISCDSACSSDCLHIKMTLKIGRRTLESLPQTLAELGAIVPPEIPVHKDTADLLRRGFSPLQVATFLGDGHIGALREISLISEGVKSFFVDDGASTMSSVPRSSAGVVYRREESVLSGCGCG